MPSSILNSDDGVISGTAGLKNSGGDDGVLVFQSKGTETARINTDKQIVAAAGTALLPSITATGDVNTGIFFSAADTLVVTTGGTAAVTVDAGQRTMFPTTIGVGGATPSTSGSGITFPATQSASSNANTLDDYEEGTWTPSLKTTSTPFSSITFSSQIGDYVKIGSYIYCQFFVQIGSVSGGAGDIQLTGLPFASSGSGRPNSGGYAQLVNNWSTNNPSNFDASGASSLDYNIQFRATSNGITQALPVAAATATAFIRGTILIRL